MKDSENHGSEVKASGPWLRPEARSNGLAKHKPEPRPVRVACQN